MISDDSFFRKIPVAIDLKQRLVWEAAGWAIDAISWSFERLKSAALQIKNRVCHLLRRVVLLDLFIHEKSTFPTLVDFKTSKVPHLRSAGRTRYRCFAVYDLNQ
jgi:hypothetical protein